MNDAGADERGAAPPDQARAMSRVLARNIRDLADRRAADAAERRTSDRLADAITRFTGSMMFVAFHLLLYGGWIAANLGWLPGTPRFDPSFVILAMEASVEAIFLSTFVLISQNRAQAEAAARADLDLHINLLAEHELTKLADLVAAIAERLGIDAGRDPDIAEIRHHVRPNAVLDAIQGTDEQD